MTSIVQSVWELSNDFRDCLLKKLVNYPEDLEKKLQKRLQFYTEGTLYYRSISLSIASNFNEFKELYESIELTELFEYHCLKRQETVLSKLQTKIVDKWFDDNPLWDKSILEIN